MKNNRPEKNHYYITLENASKRTQGCSGYYVEGMGPEKRYSGSF